MYAILNKLCPWPSMTVLCLFSLFFVIRSVSTQVSLLKNNCKKNMINLIFLVLNKECRFYQFVNYVNSLDNYCLILIVSGIWLNIMSCIQYLLVRVICKPLLYQLLDLNTFLRSNPNDCYLLSMQLIWLNPNISENDGSVSLPSLFTPQPNPYHTT